MRTMESDCWEAAKIRDEAWAKLPESRVSGDHTDCAQIWFKKGDTHALKDCEPIMFYRKEADSMEVFYIEKMRDNRLRYYSPWRPSKYASREDQFDARLHTYIPAENEWFAGHFTIKLDEQGRKDWEKRYDETASAYTFANLKAHPEDNIPGKCPRLGFMANPWCWPYDLEERIDIVKNGSGFGEKKTILLKALETCNIKSNADDWRRIFDLIATSNRCHDADNLLHDIQHADLAMFKAEDMRGNIPALDDPKAYVATEEEIRAFAAELGIDIDFVNEEKRQKNLADYSSSAFESQAERYQGYRYAYCYDHCMDLPKEFENAAKKLYKETFDNLEKPGAREWAVAKYQHYIENVKNPLADGDVEKFLGKEQELD